MPTQASSSTEQQRSSTALVARAFSKANIVVHAVALAGLGWRFELTQFSSALAFSGGGTLLCAHSGVSYALCGFLFIIGFSLDAAQAAFWYELFESVGDSEPPGEWAELSGVLGGKPKDWEILFGALMICSACGAFLFIFGAIAAWIASGSGVNNTTQHQGDIEGDYSNEESGTVSGVYALLLDGGNYYVGKANDVAKRVNEHKQGGGAGWTKKHPVVHPVCTKTQGQNYEQANSERDLESWERAETLYFAHKYGHDKVRGHMWTQIEFERRDKEFFEKMVNDRHSRCQKCNVVYVQKSDDGYYRVGRKKKSGHICDHMGERRDTTYWQNRHQVFIGIDTETPSMEDADSWERAETLLLAARYDKSKVRGHMWAKCDLSPDEEHFYEMDIRDRFDLCRKCREWGHMMKDCPAVS